MLIRRYQDGEKLNVSGLNQITVLVDRSRTALTEIGWNVWHAGLERPPHYHDAKEQVFYVTDGVGRITIGGEAYRVGPGHLIYVPMGVMHRTEVDTGASLAYILYNAFRDSDKEGHASFAEHIDEAKHERRQQANAASHGAALDWSRVESPGAHAVAEAESSSGMLPSHIILLEPPISRRCIVDMFQQPAGQDFVIEGSGASERSLFVIGGGATVVTPDESLRLDEGDVAYLPADMSVKVQPGPDGLRYLCFTTLLS